MKPPKIVSAGAGSGKTWRIADEVEALVASGVPVDAIGAVTFTEAAAAELQERIRERLVGRGLVEAAERLDAAPIRTIHAFALSLLTENPVEAGLSPAPLVLGEVEAAALLARAVNEALADPALREPILRLTRDYYAYDPGRKLGAEEQLGGDARRLCDLLRSLRLGPADRDRTVAANAADLAAAFGSPGDPAALDAALREAAEPARTFLRDFPEGKGKGDRPHAPRLAACVEAVLAPGPEGPDVARVADAVRGWSGANKDLRHVALLLSAGADAWLRRHPRVLALVQRRAADLLAVGFGVLEAYQAAKQAASALDYEDMQARALDLLERAVEGAPFAAHVAARLPHLVVDEFQDTSPLQFRIAEALRAQGTETVYVGDPRQGIYGFRGADSRLLEALERTEERAGRPPQRLDRNWRSRPELVGLVNAIFGRVFPAVGLGYTALTPAGVHVRRGIAKALPSVDVFPAGKKKELRAHLLGLLADPALEVVDRRTEEVRPVRPGDVAVLCRSNDELDAWAALLDEAGVRSVRERGGFAATLEVSLARAAMTVLANPLSAADLAALLVSELYGLSQRELAALARVGLFRAPRRLLDGDDGALAALAAEADLGAAARAVLHRFRDDLRALAGEARRRALPDLVAAILDRLRLEDAVVAKGLGAQARANLVRLVEHARAFAGLHERALEAIGATGTTLENFLFYLDAVVAPGGDAQPEPAPEDDQAVKLVTYHGAKGLEWPVVVLPSLSGSVAPRLARFEVVRPEDPAHLVGPELFARSRPRVVPACPGAALARDLAAALGGAEAARAEAARLLYVAMTRARDHLVLAWADEPDEDSGQALLQALGQVRVEPGRIVVGGEVHAARTTPPAAPDAAPPPAPPDRTELREALLAGAPLPHDPTAFALAAPPALPLAAETSPTELCHLHDDPVQARLARRGVASRYPRDDRFTAVDLSDLASGPLRRADTELEAAALGRLVHAALAAADLGPGAPGLAGEALSAAIRGRLAGLPAQEVEVLAGSCAAAVRNVRALAASLGAVALAREVPFVVCRGPHRLSGAIDLALRTSAGWHVVDHKVHPIARANVPRWAAFYGPQLDAYALALEALGRGPVVARHLAFHTTGVLATLRDPVDLARLDALLDLAAREG